MSITADLNRSLELEENGLRDEYFARFHAKSFYLVFCEVDLFPRFAAFHLQEFFNDLIDVDIRNARVHFDKLSIKRIVIKSELQKTEPQCEIKSLARF